MMRRFCLSLVLVSFSSFIAPPQADAAVVDGPRYIVRQIQPGKTHSLRITIKGNRYADFATALQFAANLPLQMTIVHDGADSVWVAGVTNAYQNLWRPYGDCTLVIRVTNLSPVAVNYTMLVQ